MSRDTRSYLAKIARMYYLEELSQQHIARKMSISIATVSRALRKAKELRVVRIEIDEPADAGTDLELAIEARWKLAECAIVPTLEREAGTHRLMALAVTEILSRVLRRGSTLGVSWGETLRAVGEHLGELNGQDVRVIPIIGAMGEIDTGIYPNSIAREFADHLKGIPYMFNLPALVADGEIRDSIIRTEHYAGVQKVWDTLDVAILSVSGLSEDISAFRSGIFSSGELAMLRERGGVCATNFTILDQAGVMVENPIAERIIGVPFLSLKTVDHVIVVAGGVRKVDALRAALNAGVVTRLVTDVECARGLLR